MNQQFQRNMEIMDGMKKMNINSNILDDRDLFNKISNTDNTTNYMDRDKRLGQTSCNRKDLNENVYNNGNNSNFKALDNFNYNNFENFNNDNINIENSENIENLRDIRDELERDVMIYEYTSNINKEKEFLFDINSPYGIAYVWKTLLLVTKNPSNDKIMRMLNIKNREIMINDLNNQSEIFSDFGEITYNVDVEENMNINFVKKMNEMYRIKCINSLNSKNICLINMIFRYELKIPYYYNPEIINYKFVNYRDIPLKFIKMLNVPCSLLIINSNNNSNNNNNNKIINVEIPICENMRLGFIYREDNELVEDYDMIYDLVMIEKRYNIKIRNIVIPKINRSKKSNYSNKFSENLDSVHLGEVCYGKMMKVMMNIYTKMEINVENKVEIERYEIERMIDSIIINGRMFYYVKNEKIKNRILFSGVINYK